MSETNDAIAHLATRAAGLHKRICALEALEALRSRDRSPRMPIEFCSQFGEDAEVWTLLGRPIDGFYVEAGAFDGREFSVTYALEAMGWTGLLVEGIPERAEACRVNRPFSRVVHAALVGDESVREVEFDVVEDPYGGMFSHAGACEHHTACVAELGLPSRKVRVPATTLNSLLVDYAGPIDLLVLDVEGGELDVLRGFDLVKHRPKVMILEDNTRSDGSELVAYMAQHPYRNIGWIGVNRIYVHADETAILARAGCA